MNKTTLLTLFAVLCITVFSQAQEARYGLRAGINISSINSDQITEDLEDNRFGFLFGFLAEYPLTNNLGIQPELQYSAQGNKDENLRINYLQLPVLLKYNITEMFNIQLGPQAGLKIWEWEKNENFNTLAFSAVAGLGANITENIFIDARYAFGLTNVFDDETLPGADGKSQNIQISIGYRL